jgi:hypothetical protein
MITCSFKRNNPSIALFCCSIVLLDKVVTYILQITDSNSLHPHLSNLLPLIRISYNSKFSNSPVNFEITRFNCIYLILNRQDRKINTYFVYIIFFFKKNQSKFSLIRCCYLNFIKYKYVVHFLFINDYLFL